MSLTKRQAETQGGIFSDQCSSNKQCKLTNQPPNKQCKLTNQSPNKQCKLTNQSPNKQCELTNQSPNKQCKLTNQSPNKQCKLTNQSPEKDEQQLNENVKSTTQADDEALLNVIESADLDQAVQLIKGENHFSQDGLDRALISACRHGLKFLVQELVCLGANVQVKDALGNTPLLICAESGFVDIVLFLLKMKADVNASNDAGDTALILSMRPAVSLEMVRVLLDQNGIYISHQNRDGYTALMKAIEARDVDVIKILMDSNSKEEVNGSNSRQACERCCLGSLEAVNSKGMTAKEIADKCGLGNIYNILKTHRKTRLSLLDTLIERKDADSLNILLNCHFVEKKEIQTSFENIFENVYLNNQKTFTEKEIMIIKRLLKFGAEVDTSCYCGSTPLYVAVNMGNYDLVELLCQHLDQQQQQLSSDFIKAAAKSGRCDLIDLLLKYNADINNNNYYSGSPLDCALSHGHLESAKLLGQHGAKMDIERALQSSVTQKLPEYMNFVLENYQPEVNSYVAKGGGELNKMLVSASKDGNLEIIGRLLDAGADVNHEVCGETPLGESKDVDVARFLINRGATLITLIDGAEPMLLQVLNNRNPKDSSTLEVVKVLLENGASVNESGNDGRTPLMAAASSQESVALLQMLLDHGADINSQDKRGNTALMEAVSESCPLNVSFLLEFHTEKGLSLNAQNNEGKTALMFAVTDGSSKILKQLLDFGADVNTKDMNGNTPLHCSIINNYRPMENLRTLIKAGSDVNSQNNDGFSSLMLAVKCRFQNVIILLLDSGADVNAVSEKDSTKTAMSFLPYYKDYVKSCIEAFLAKGASSSYLKRDVLHRMILAGEIDLIPELIQHGLGPADLETMIFDITTDTEISTVSPLCMSLLVGNVSLARYFAGNLFLTYSDVTTLRENKTLRDELEGSQRQFLEEFSSQPLSLFQLAFVKVTSAVGSSPGREDRVNVLPLPQAMKDKLLFKSQDILLDVSSKDSNCFSQGEEIRFLDNYSENYTDSDDSSDYDFYDSDTDWGV